MGQTPENTTLTQAQVQRDQDQNINQNVNQNANQNINQNAVAQQNVMVKSTQWEEDTLGQQRLSAWDQAEGIVKEFNENQSVGLKSKTRRKMVLNTKRKNYAAAKEIVARQAQPAQGNAQPGQVDQPAQADNRTVTVREIKMLLTKDFEFMAYKDDESFLDIYDGAHRNLSILESIYNKVKDMSNVDYTTLKGQYGDDLPSLENLKKTGKMYADQKKHYEYKLKLISNPFYTVLQNRDTASMSIDELTAQRDKCRRAQRNALADYLDTTIEMKKLAKEGTGREIDKSDLVTAYRKNIGGGTYKHHKGYFEAGTVKWKLSTDSHLRAGGVKEGVEADPKNINSISDFETVETRPKDEVKIGTEVDATLKAKAVKGSYKYKSRFFDFAANASAGAAAVKGGIGAKIAYHQDEGVHAGFRGRLRGEGQLVKSRVKAAVHFGDSFSASIKNKAKLGEIWSDNTVKVGKFRLNDDDESGEVWGAYAKSSFGVSLASNMTSTAITIKGIKFSFAINTQFGALGGEASGYLTSGGIGASLGFLAGLGLNMKLDVDYSYYTNKLMDKIINKIKGDGKK